MLQYLIILLDNTSISFCHHKNTMAEKHLIPLDVLKDGIIFGMKENLHIQFVLPEYQIPLEYWQEMMTIDHSIIVSGNVDFEELIPQNVFYQLPNVLVFDDISKFKSSPHKTNQTCVLRLGKDILFSHVDIIALSLANVSRLNLTITDIESFSDNDFKEYDRCLSVLAEAIKNIYLKDGSTQLNILTDRMMLKQMNNCDAGVNNITLAPDGCFYICPAFYQGDCETITSKKFNIGSLSEGVNIKNAYLYKIDYAPLCRICDSYHCKRCVWLNYKTTYEVNTPSHEQCVITHLERNASRKLLNGIRKYAPNFLEGVEIKEINYLDPFDIRKEL